jgi:hypothetical protein
MLENIPQSRIFIGSKPETTKPFVEAGIRTIFAIHINEQTQKQFKKQGILVIKIPTIIDPIVNPKLINEIVKIAKKKKRKNSFYMRGRSTRFKCLCRNLFSTKRLEHK